MRMREFSHKQGLIFRFMAQPETALICDGAVRSGKTAAMSAAFLLWAMAHFNRTNFAICGKTVQSVERNLLVPLQAVEGLPYRLDYKVSKMLLTVRCGNIENSFYLFGGKDARSYTLIQGITLAGVLFDEVALMPRSFVDQAIARTLTYPDKKLWFNCNPETPGHWFYREWVQHPERHNAVRLHFLMQDNPAMTPETIRAAEAMFSGVFYKRYILGLWVAAEGAVYPQFAAEPDAYCIDGPPAIRHAVIGVDFGGSGSAHSFTLTGFTPGVREVVVLDEYYHDNREKGVLSPKQVEDAFVGFVRRAQSRWPVYEAYCDSAEQTLIQGLRLAAARAGIGIDVRNAKKGPINERIAFYNSLMARRRFLVCRSCTATIQALRDAVYDGKKPGQDERLDDGSTNIDSLDSLEYSTESAQADILAMGWKEAGV